MPQWADFVLSGYLRSRPDHLLQCGTIYLRAWNVGRVGNVPDSPGCQTSLDAQERRAATAFTPLPLGKGAIYQCEVMSSHPRLQG